MNREVLDRIEVSKRREAIRQWRVVQEGFDLLMEVTGFTEGEILAYMKQTGSSVAREPRHWVEPA